MDERQLYMSTVKLGPKGQIVIPKEVREMLGVQAGDALLIMADSQRGIALQKQSVMNDIADAVFAGKGAALYPDESAENMQAFARSIEAVRNGGEVRE